jgi:hypothetical protein
MVVETSDDRGLHFVCLHDDCGRRMVMQRAGGYTVIERGDERALHSGSEGPVAFSIAVD